MKKHYSHYKFPHQILEDSTLSTADKIALLEDWEADEEQKLIATEENMPLNQIQDEDEGERLSEISKALEHLRSK